MTKPKGRDDEGGEGEGDGTPKPIIPVPPTRPAVVSMVEVDSAKNQKRETVVGPNYTNISGSGGSSSSSSSATSSQKKKLDVGAVVDAILTDLAG
jgi:hypothetical protein